MTTGSRTVTKRDVVERISDRTGLKKTDVKTVLQEFLDEIVEELGTGNRLEFRDFGVFEVRRRAARTAQNPKTLEPVPVPEKSTVKFKPGRRMKEVLENGTGLNATGGSQAVNTGASTIEQVAEVKPQTSMTGVATGMPQDNA